MPTCRARRKSRCSPRARTTQRAARIRGNAGPAGPSCLPSPLRTHGEGPGVRFGAPHPQPSLRLHHHTSSCPLQLSYPTKITKIRTPVLIFASRNGTIISVQIDDGQGAGIAQCAALTTTLAGLNRGPLKSCTEICRHDMIAPPLKPLTCRA